MATTLANRAELRLAFQRLTGFGSSDGSLSARETSAGDAVNAWLQQALWDAQAWYLSNVDPHRWLTVSSALSWSGSDATGGRYTALPTDFLRLYGDQEVSALHEANGNRWGRLVQPEQRTSRGNGFYLLDDNLYLLRGAAPPTVYLDYAHRHPTLSDDTGTGSAGLIDFPLDDRNLVVAFAGKLASLTPGVFPGDSKEVALINEALKEAQEIAYTRGRRTREPRKVRRPAALGSHWFSTGR